MRVGSSATVLRARGLIGRARRRATPGEHRTWASFDGVRGRFYRKLWRDAAAALGAEVSDLGSGMTRVRLGSSWTWVRGAEVAVDDHLTLDLAGDKLLVHRLLSEARQPVPKHAGFTLATVAVAEAFLADNGDVTVVKPATATAAGHGVRTNVRSVADLRAAVAAAARFGGELLIEEQIAGDSFRLLYLDGVLIDAVRRRSPCVTGDGQLSLHALVDRENQRRLDADPMIALGPLTLDAEADSTLDLQGLRRTSVPASGRIVRVKTAVNQNAREANECVLGHVHPTIAEAGALAARIVGARLLGVDLIATAIDRPLLETGGVVNEINTTPGLHHHVLVTDPDPSKGVAERVLAFALTARGGGDRPGVDGRALPA